MNNELNLTDLSTAVEILRKGGVILYPTDTVWGIGCDATNAEAISKVYQIKQRAESKALITLVSDLGMLERTVEGIPEVAYSLIEFSDRPLTIIYDKAIGVAPNLPADDGSLAVRVAADTFCQALCRRLGRPIVSTSANISGQQTPKNFDEISTQIKDSVDYVCLSNRNSNSLGKPSGIIRLCANGEFKIIR